MTSRAVDVLFALPDTHDPTTAGARRQARANRLQEMTEASGSAAANTQFANEAKAEADRVTASITPKVEQMETEDLLLSNTIKQLRATQSSAPSPLASGALAPNPAATPRAQALGEARAAEYYESTAKSLDAWARRWGPGIIILMAIGAVIWQWYHRQRMLPLIIVMAGFILASFYPVYIMQLPRAAISPLMKLVPGPV